MNEPFKISVVRSGSEALVYVTATGCGIYLLRLITVCVGHGNGCMSGKWFRPGGYFDFEVGGEQIEPYIFILKAREQIGNAPAKVSASAYYVRVDRVARVEADV